MDYPFDFREEQIYKKNIYICMLIFAYFNRIPGLNLTWYVHLNKTKPHQKSSAEL